jgi:hypothetical protein
MTTFFLWWFAASIVAAGVNYVLMQFTDDDD